MFFGGFCGGWGMVGRSQMFPREKGFWGNVFPHPHSGGVGLQGWVRSTSNFCSWKASLLA